MAMERKAIRYLANFHILSNDTNHSTTHRSSDPSWVNQSAHDVLPNVSTVLLDSNNVFKTLHVHVQNIQNQLKDMQNADGASFAKQSSEYDHQLSTQQAEITTAEARNAHMTTQLEELRKSNKGLRKKAAVLAEGCHKVRVDIRQIQNNVSIAMEFMHQTLNVSEMLLNASEVQITKELDMQDLQMQKRLAQVKSMKLMGMLQVRSEQKLVPAEVVQGLIGSLEDYAKQKTTHENNLKAKFERRFRAGSEQLQGLQDEYKELSNTYQAEDELKSKLISAVQHLEKTYVQLVRQKQSIAKFFENLKDHNKVD